jgi:tetraacyldisaccharide 4'-kinase
MPAPNPHTPLSVRTRFATRLQRSWARRDWLAVSLYDVSLLYRGLVALRRWLYARGVFESTRLPVPVVVVGNVVAGGAGKTPVVIAIVQHLQRAGWQPGVVSRGYGRVDVTRGNNRAGVPHGNNRAGAPDGGPDDSGCLAVTQDTPVALSGDEPALVHRATGAPVWVGADRPNAAFALLAAHPSVNVIVSDDGLQHLALQRDIEICVFDDRGVGNGWLLPAGPLREPWPRSSKSNEPWPHNQAVDFVLHTAAQPPANSNSNAPVFHCITRQLAPYAVRADGSRTALADLQGQALHAVAAIAQPEAFFSMLRQQGLTLAHTTALPDHYNFNSWLSSNYGPEPLICTEKDAVKLWPMYPQALAVPLVVNLPADFLAALLARLVALPTPPDPAD